MTWPIRNMRHFSTPWQESMWCIHQNVQGTRNHVLRPNKQVLYTLATRQQIHHGDGQNWQQCHPCQTHVKLQGWGDDKGIWRTPQPTETSGHCPKETRTQQQGFRKHKKPHLRHTQVQHGIGATRVPSTECSRGGHTQLQSPFPQHTCRGIRWLSTKLMGLTNTTNRNHHQSYLTI